MPRRLHTLAAALMGVTLSQVAMAELYISPVLRDTITYSNDQGKPAPAPASAPAKPVRYQAPAAAKAVAATPTAAPPSGSIKGTSSVHGEFEMKAQPKAGALFGKNVPLFVALENLVPDSKSWNMAFEPGTENIPVSWRGANTWRDAVTQISQGYRLVIAINEPAKRIAVARNAELAKRLAKGEDVWQLKSGISLRANLEEWAKKAGWKLDWGTTQIDYPVDHSSTLVGSFAGQGGVVDRVLSATKTREVPLTGKFYRGNNVVVIQDAGYKPEVPITPVIDNESY